MPVKNTKTATPTSASRSPADDHLPRRGLYALAARWRTTEEQDDDEWKVVSEPMRTHLIWEGMGRDAALRRCADELERAIATLPIDRQHTEAMLQFEHRSATAIRNLEEVSGALKLRMDTLATLVNALLVEFNRIRPDVHARLRELDKWFPPRPG